MVLYIQGVKAIAIALMMRWPSHVINDAGGGDPYTASQDFL